MSSTPRRFALVLAGTALLAATVTGCSSSSGDSTATTGASATAVPTPVTEPIVLSYGTARTTAAVGQAIDFDVEYDQGKWTIESSDPKVLAVTPGSTQGTAVMNPGGVALAPGTSDVRLTLPGGGKIWFVEVTVTG